MRETGCGYEGAYRRAEVEDAAKIYFNEATHITPEMYKQIERRLTRKGQSKSVIVINGSDFPSIEDVRRIKEFVSEATDKPRKYYKDNPRKQIDQLDNNKYL